MTDTPSDEDRALARELFTDPDRPPRPTPTAAPDPETTETRKLAHELFARIAEETR